MDKALIVQGAKYFSKLAKERIDKLPPAKLQEFLGYLIDEIAFDSNKMEAKISAHIPVIRKGDGKGYANLFHSPPDLTGETWNKNLKFELGVKV